MHSASVRMNFMTALIEIQVVFADTLEQIMIDLQVEAGTTVESAVEQSGIRARMTHIDLRLLTYGIWNQARSGQDIVSDGDRIELYRPLEVDPKEARRRRAERDRS